MFNIAKKEEAMLEKTLKVVGCSASLLATGSMVLLFGGTTIVFLGVAFTLGKSAF